MSPTTHLSSQMRVRRLGAVAILHVMSNSGRRLDDTSNDGPGLGPPTAASEQAGLELEDLEIEGANRFRAFEGLDTRGGVSFEEVGPGQSEQGGQDLCWRKGFGHEQSATAIVELPPNPLPGPASENVVILNDSGSPRKSLTTRL